MKRIERKDLISAAEKIGISQDQAEKLWGELDAQQTLHRFDLSQVLYYFGALLVLAAMSWFVGETWERFGGQGIFWVALTYIFIFLTLGTVFWNKGDLKTPGGLFITLAVCMIPIAVYGLQKWLGWWITDQPGQYRDFFSWIKGGWFLMEMATLLGGCLALYFYRFSFLTMPIFFTLWFMSMDIVPLFFEEKDNIEDIRKKISIVFGIGLLIAAYIIDLKSETDLAFWPYFFGVLTFWGGLSLLEASSEFTRFLYLLINLGLMFLSVLLQRIVFLVFGALGVVLYISSIFDKYFSNSLSFPIILSLIGVLVVFFGILYHKNRAKIESSIMHLFPSSAKKWFPRR